MQKLRALSLIFLLAGAHSFCLSADVKVLVAGAAKSAFEKIALEFERTSGHKLEVRYDTVGALRDRVLAGEKVDLVVLSSTAVDTLEQKGLVAVPDRRLVGIVVSGLAVRAGSAVPDISTETKLKQVLLAAPSIAQADGARGATSGAHFTKLIDTLGLREALANRLILLPFGVDAIHGVEQGKYALGVSQSSEIIPIAGVTFVGEFPSPHSLRTAYAAAAIGSSETGKQLGMFMNTEFARKQYAGSGFAAP
jgi:molybdate transport system substrate-binding protein